MKQRGWRYIVAVVVAGALLLSMPAKPVSAETGGCTTCNCTPPPASLDCNIEPGETCTIDADCASDVCSDENLCTAIGGSCTLTLPNCPVGTVPSSTVESYLCNPPRICDPMGNMYVRAGFCNFRQVCTGFNFNTTRECDWVSDPQYAKLVCVPSCTTSAPTAPALGLPVDGAKIGTTNVSLSWNAPTDWGVACSGTRSYGISVRNAVKTIPPSSPFYATTTEFVTTMNFTGVMGRTYIWYVIANNGELTTVSEQRYFTLAENQIMGRVYDDTQNNCGGSGLAGVTVSLDGGSSTTVTDTNGDYSFTAAPASHTLSVIIPAGYSCSTATGCNTCSSSGITPGSSSAVNNNFYLTRARASWWQTEGAGVYIGGSQLRSILPSASSRLILAPAGGTAAALLMASGSPELGNLGSISDSLWIAKTKYKGKTMGYDYFAAHMGIYHPPKDKKASSLREGFLFLHSTA